jgi:hypothetical protein
MGHTESNVTVVWNKQYNQNQPGDLVAVTVKDASASTLFGKCAPFSYANYRTQDIESV